jgi:hypothetical protein
MTFSINTFISHIPATTIITPVVLYLNSASIQVEELQERSPDQEYNPVGMSETPENCKIYSSDKEQYSSSDAPNKIGLSPYEDKNLISPDDQYIRLLFCR